MEETLGGKPHLSHALMGEEYVSIDDERVKTGRNCGCKCPACWGDLEARKDPLPRGHPRVRPRYFAHQPGADCHESPEHMANVKALMDLLKTMAAQKACWQIRGPTLADAGQDLLGWTALGDGMAVSIDMEGVTIRRTGERVEQNDPQSPRPDIALWRGGPDPLLIIEVVRKHKPDKQVLAWANRKKVPIALFHIKGKEEEARLDQSGNVSGETVAARHDRPDETIPPLWGQCEVCGKLVSAKEHGKRRPPRYTHVEVPEPCAVATYGEGVHCPECGAEALARRCVMVRKVEGGLLEYMVMPLETPDTPWGKASTPGGALTGTVLPDGDAHIIQCPKLHCREPITLKRKGDAVLAFPSVGADGTSGMNYWLLGRVCRACAKLHAPFWEP